MPAPVTMTIFVLFATAREMLASVRLMEASSAEDTRGTAIVVGNGGRGHFGFLAARGFEVVSGAVEACMVRGEEGGAPQRRVAGLRRQSGAVRKAAAGEEVEVVVDTLSVKGNGRVPNKTKR